MQKTVNLINGFYPIWYRKRRRGYWHNNSGNVLQQLNCRISTTIIDNILKPIPIITTYHSRIDSQRGNLILIIDKNDLV